MRFKFSRNFPKQLASLLLALGLVLTARARRAASRPSRRGAVTRALRALPAAALLAAFALAGFAIQACSSHDAQRASSFRDQSVEITSLLDAAEFYLADAQQSPLAVTNKAASVQSRTALHPFGQVRFQTGTQNDPWGFVGNEEDRGSGISDFHARPYRPELGVFLAVDPIALLSPEMTIGSPNRMFAYAYAGGDPITQADANGLTFGEFVHGMWDQGVENLKVTASATVASVRSNAALAMSGDIEGAAANLVVGSAHGMIQTVKDVSNFGNDFAKAVYAGSDYEAGRLAVKPVMTAMNLASTVMGARMNLEKAGASRAAALEGEAKAASTSGPKVYRQGTFADTKTGWDGNSIKGRQWASDNPITTPDYAKKYGLPAENSGTPDWVVGGRVEGEFTTRPAPASHNCPGNSGGANEVLPTNPESVRLDWFHMPDK